MSAFFFFSFQESTRVVQPIFLGKIIDYFEKYDPNDSVALHTAYGYAAVLSVCTLILAILHHLYFYHVQCAGMRLRVAMCHMIYRKVSDSDLPSMCQPKPRERRETLRKLELCRCTESCGTRLHWCEGSGSRKSEVQGPL